MTVRELIERLEGVDPDKVIVVYAEGTAAGGVEVDGLDSYEDAMALVPSQALEVTK